MTEVEGTVMKVVNETYRTLSEQTCKSEMQNEVQNMLKENGASRKRRKILNEIYQTERTYQHHLTLLITLFLEPIRVSAVLPKPVIDGVFSNVEQILRVSTNLLERMEEHGVLRALLEHAPFFRLYSLYANNFDNADKLIDEWQRKSGDFARLLQYQESLEEMQCLKMRSLLITPVQRVPRSTSYITVETPLWRPQGSLPSLPAATHAKHSHLLYRLLLYSLLDHTPENDRDYSKLKDVCNEIESVATHINECLRQHENFQKMLSIQNSFTGANAPKILSPGRYFLNEGTVTKISDSTTKGRTLFLFSDILILAKKETSCTYQCKEVYPLVESLVEQVMGSSEVGSNLFKVICREHPVLMCSSLTKQAWVADIKRAISVLHSNLASLNREDSDRQPSVKYTKQTEKRKRTSLKIFKCSSTNSIHGPSNSYAPPVLRKKDATKHTPFNQTRRVTSLYDLNHNETHALGVVNHNFNSFTEDSTFFRSGSLVEERSLLESPTQGMTTTIGEDEVFNRSSRNTSHSSQTTTTTSKTKHNWSVTESERQQQHDTDEDRKSTFGKITFNKRKLRQTQHRNIYSKQFSDKTNEDEECEYSSLIDQNDRAKRQKDESTSCSIM